VAVDVVVAVNIS